MFPAVPFTCPFCSAARTITPAALLDPVRCEGCGKRFRVPKVMFAPDPSDHVGRLALALLAAVSEWVRPECEGMVFHHLRRNLPAHLAPVLGEERNKEGERWRRPHRN